MGSDVVWMFPWPLKTNAAGDGMGRGGMAKLHAFLVSPAEVIQAEADVVMVLPLCRSPRWRGAVGRGPEWMAKCQGCKKAAKKL